ncbi:DinB family protein [Deinococcus altitudinis]|uniref:DinB family protein n=1 Tax=Deinococcus altitudinis TaxID=468914 RepID=UPI0038923761
MTDAQKPYFIRALPPYSPHIGALVQMMAYARLTTVQAVEGMNGAELDAVPPGFSNSVGMLLAHIAATDRLYQAASFEGRDIYDAPEYAPHLGAMTFGHSGEPVRGRTLEHLLSELENVRAHTLSQLARRDDAWLAAAAQVPGFADMNQHWAWFHVMEDEVSHRGQIRILRRAIQQAAQG